MPRHLGRKGTEMKGELLPPPYGAGSWQQEHCQIACRLRCLVPCLAATALAVVNFSFLPRMSSVPGNLLMAVTLQSLAVMERRSNWPPHPPVLHSSPPTC